MHSVLSASIELQSIIPKSLVHMVKCEIAIEPLMCTKKTNSGPPKMQVEVNSGAVDQISECQAGRGTLQTQEADYSAQHSDNHKTTTLHNSLMPSLFRFYETGNIPVLSAAWCNATTGEEVNILLKKFGLFV